MLKNYFKIALAVLRRRKFFTFISLFGISITLTILMVLTAFIDKVMNDDYPDRKRDRSLYINSLEEVGKNDRNGGPLSFYFLKHYSGSIKTPVKLAISSGSNSTNTYVNNKKIDVRYKYTNAAYWEVLDYDFIEGKPFTKQQIDNGEHVAVITEELKKEYFGDVPAVLGKYIEADNVQYKICGVVKNVPITNYILYSDIFLPYTISKTDYNAKDYRGEYLGILLAASRSDVPKMRKEYQQMIARVPMSSKEYDKIYSYADTYFTAFFRTGHEGTSGVTIALTVVGIFTLLVMLLPTLNLVNINITRIMERSSEIGVRKAFGASSKTLVYQFIVENCILTLIGGLIGTILSFVIIQVFNAIAPVPNLFLSLNVTVLALALLTCLVFGLLSGVYPAWRMSRLHVVTALKAS
jgi:putative ABC transport system permease protein